MVVRVALAINWKVESHVMPLLAKLSMSIVFTIFSHLIFSHEICKKLVLHFYYLSFYHKSTEHTWARIKRSFPLQVLGLT